MKTLKVAKFELIKLIRDKRLLIVFLIQPIVLITLLGLSNRHEPQKIELALFDKSKTEYSNKIVNDLGNEKNLVVKNVSTESELLDLINNDKVRGAVTLDINKNDSQISGEIKYIENSTVPDLTSYAKLLCLNAAQNSLVDFVKENVKNNVTAEIGAATTTSQQAIDRKIAGFTKQIAQLTLEPATSATIKSGLEGLKDVEPVKIEGFDPSVSAVTISTEKNTKKDVKYFDYFASAVIVLLVIFVSLNSSSTTITQERIDGTFERFFVTPYTKNNLILGKMLAFSVAAMTLAVLTIFSLTTIFDVTIGPLWLVLFVTYLTSLAALALGIMISALTYTIAESIQAASLVFFSTLILTTFLFQPETMHPSIKFVSKVIPFTYSVKAMREINLLNINFDDIWKNIVIIFGTFILFLLLSIVLLKRKTN